MAILVLLAIEIVAPLTYTMFIVSLHMNRKYGYKHVQEPPITTSHIHYFA